MLPQISVNYRGFYETWLRLDEMMKESCVGFHVCPWIVNGAFACELGMKYILACNNSSTPRGHLLHILYGQLPEKDQYSIWINLRTRFPDYTIERLSREVKLLSDAFCSFRYAHEHTLAINVEFCRAWFEAVFEQVSTYPSFRLVECTEKQGISTDEFDVKIKKTQDEMLSRLEKKGKPRK